MRKFIASSLAVSAIVAAVVVNAADYTPVSKESPTITTPTLTSPTVTTMLAITPGNLAQTGGVITVTAPVMVITPSGGTNGASRTFTLAAPLTTRLYTTLTLIGGAAATNAIAIADSGMVNLSAAWAGAATDTLTLYATATNKWTEIARSNN